jgi:hypothetical protein
MGSDVATENDITRQYVQMVQDRHDVEDWQHTIQNPSMSMKPQKDKESE